MSLLATILSKDFQSTSNPFRCETRRTRREQCFISPLRVNPVIRGCRLPSSSSRSNGVRVTSTRKRATQQKVELISSSRRSSSFAEKDQRRSIGDVLCVLAALILPSIFLYLLQPNLGRILTDLDCFSLFFC